MVDEDRLSSVLSELAFTLATDFPIRSILDHLVERIVDVLPVTSAGVTLIDAGASPRYVAASDGSALLYERLQSDLGQGPCLLAYETGEPVAVPDLRLDDRFPDFTPSALAAGLAAVFTFPLRHGDGRFGALDLYRETRGELDQPAMEAAQTLADVAGAYLLNARAREDALVDSVRMRHIAMHDALTGLPNRLLLQERIGHASRRAARTHAHAAVMFIDLDKFKEVNDEHGHAVGDQLLRTVARRLTQLVRPGDTLARVYGDEFVLLCEDLDDRADVQVVADRIQDAFTTPFATSGTRVNISASIGIAFAGPGEQVTEQLVEEADTAMYDVKRTGLTQQIVDLRAEVRKNDSGRLSRELRTAADDGRLHVVYQPVVRCTDSVVCGVEALLRWDHPDRGPVPAASIVAVAEQTDLMGRIGKWVLTETCQDAVRWLHDHPTLPLDLAVNISAYQLMVPGFADEVSDVLATTGMAATSLILEVTENILIEESELALSVVDHLRTLGIRVALDDFGTGYSSLSYLHRLPIDILKIDRTFVHHVDQAPRGGAIIAAVTDLAHALNMLVVTEGVETKKQQAVATAMGADQAQGYFYARPLPAAGIDSMLAVATPGPWHLYGDAAAS